MRVERDDEFIFARACSFDNTVPPQLCIYDKNKGCLLTFRYLSSSVFMRVRLYTCETVIECGLWQFHYVNRRIHRSIGTTSNVKNTMNANSIFVGRSSSKQVRRKYKVNEVSHSKRSSSFLSILLSYSWSSQNERKPGNSRQSWEIFMQKWGSPPVVVVL